MHLRGPQKSNTHSMPLLLNSRIISYSWTAHNSYWERQFKANSKLEFSSLSLATFLNNSLFIMCLIQVLLCLLWTTCLLAIAINTFKCKKKNKLLYSLCRENRQKRRRNLQRLLWTFVLICFSLRTIRLK